VGRLTARIREAPYVEITIQFCLVCDYFPTAVSVAEELVRTYGRNLTSITLLPASGGLFEVTYNDSLIFSKKALYRAPETGEIVALIDQQRRESASRASG
jgi:selenoprotein W-related protein